jgi:hypothetical protein
VLLELSVVEQRYAVMDVLRNGLQVSEVAGRYVTSLRLLCVGES